MVLQTSAGVSSDLSLLFEILKCEGKKNNACSQNIYPRARATDVQVCPDDFIGMNSKNRFLIQPTNLLILSSCCQLDNNRPTGNTFG